MALQERDRIRYAELVDEFLDKIPYETFNDFELVINGLESIIYPELKFDISHKLVNYLKNIQELFNSPELYVKDKKDYADYEFVLKQRITFKIMELSNLSFENKEKFIQKTHSKNEQRNSYQKKIIGKKPPKEGSAAHVLSENTWIQALQNNHDVFQGRYAKSIQSLVVQCKLLSLDEFLALDSTAKDDIIRYESSIQAFVIQCKLWSLHDFLALEPKVKDELLRYEDSIAYLVVQRKLLSLHKYLALEPRVKEQLAHKSTYKAAQEILHSSQISDKKTSLCFPRSNHSIFFTKNNDEETYKFSTWSFEQHNV